MYEEKRPITIYNLIPPSSLGFDEGEEFQNRREVTPIYLFGALRVATRLQTTDPLDRVYGILGLVTDVEAGDLTIDYKKTEAEVQIDIARFFLRKKTRLLFLPHARLISSSSGTSSASSALSNASSLSSWIPSWTGDSLFWANESASGSVKAQLSTISADGTTLTVQGMRIDHFARSCHLISKKSMLVDLAIFAWSVVGNEQDSFRLGRKIRGVLENLATTLVKPAVTIMNTTFDISDEEFFLYMLLILRWPAIDKFAESSLGDIAKLRVSDAVSFDVIFTILHSCSSNDPSPFRLVDLQRISTDSDFGRSWEGYNDFIRYIGISLRQNCISVTAKGDFVLVKDVPLKKGDEIWILFGCSYPMVLRPAGNHYMVVSPVCMHGSTGVMNGLILHGNILGFENVLMDGKLKDVEQPLKDGKTLGGYEVCTIQLK
jgi:hypothetical protein